MTRALKSFLRNESGATAIEYSMIAAVAFVAIISSIIYLGDNVTNTFTIVGEVWTDDPA